MTLAYEQLVLPQSIDWKVLGQIMEEVQPSAEEFVEHFQQLNVGVVQPICELLMSKLYPNGSKNVDGHNSPVDYGDMMNLQIPISMLFRLLSGAKAFPVSANVDIIQKALISPLECLIAQIENATMQVAFKQWAEEKGSTDGRVITFCIPQEEGDDFEISIPKSYGIVCYDTESEDAAWLVTVPMVLSYQNREEQFIIIDHVKDFTGGVGMDSKSFDVLQFLSTRFPKIISLSESGSDSY